MVNVKNTTSVMIGLSLSSLVGTTNAEDINKKTINPESMPAIVAGVRDSDYRTLNTEEMSQIVGAVALPTGRWSLISNGFPITLNITNVNAANGAVTGTIMAGLSTYNITGIYNDTINQFAFIWPLNPADPNATQVYNGIYYTEGVSPTPNQMAGTFIAFTGAGGAPTQNTYAWRAGRP